MFYRNHHFLKILYCAFFASVFLLEIPNGSKFASATNALSSEECQPPWWPVSEIKCARYLQEPPGKYYLPFREASDACHSLGEGHAHLLTITSPAEQAAVESHLVNPSPIDGPYLMDSDFWVEVGGGESDNAAFFANYISEEEAKKEGRTLETSGNSTCAVVLVDGGKWRRASCREKHRIVCQKVLFGKAAHMKKLEKEQLEERFRALERNFQQSLKDLEQRLKLLSSTETKRSAKEKESWSEEDERARMEAVKEMARAAWNASKSGGGEWYSGRLVLGALSTLQVMGLQAEAAEARQWLKREFHFEKLGFSMEVGAITTEYLGGLLSAYALAGGGGGSGEDKVLLERAVKIAQAIRPAYSTPSGMPYLTFNPTTGSGQGETPPASAVGGDLLERTYLAELTGNRLVQSPAELANLRLLSLKLYSATESSSGYFESFVNVTKGKRGAWSDPHRAGLSRHTDDLYRALLGSFRQVRGKTAAAEANLVAYARAVEELVSAGIIRAGNDSTNGLGAVLELDIARKSIANEGLMEYETCYVGGLLALGAVEIEKKARLIEQAFSAQRETLFTRQVAARHRKLATQIAETCYQASTRTATKLGPASFSPGNFEVWSAGIYNLGPELAETHFLLWRLTGQTKYRDRAWEMAQAIRQYARAPNGGYSSVLNVDDITTKGGKNMYTGTLPHFLSATLKYLYLTFAPIDVLPLNKWVFNSVGHPLPICGHHPEAVYPTKQCDKVEL